MSAEVRRMFYSLPEISQMFQRPQGTLRRDRFFGTEPDGLVSVKVGGRILYPRAAVDGLIAELEAEASRSANGETRWQQGG